MFLLKQLFTNQVDGENSTQTPHISDQTTTIPKYNISAFNEELASDGVSTCFSEQSISQSYLDDEWNGNPLRIVCKLDTRNYSHRF